MPPIKPTGTVEPGPQTQDLLRALTDDLAQPEIAALARVWMVAPGDLCPTCPMRSECPDRRRCLHLVASAGATTRTDGPYRRFPIGARRVGQVASTMQPFVAREELAASGLAEPAWLLNHGVQSFAALPLIADGDLLGVLALFSRRVLSNDEVQLLELTARHAAIALAAARTRDLSHSASHETHTSSKGAAPPSLRTLSEIQREAIERVLEHTGGRVSGPRGAAAILGLKPTTLASRMLKLGVRRRVRSRAVARDPTASAHGDDEL
ncbi:MAG TPA: GAF domain-containing protein [Candidatus Limnocylindria bacterium]|nr:GAF domain-containing protein [Candidatus Limnocylindria bacterium]